jgi:hypothetical protein
VVILVHDPDMKLVLAHVRGAERDELSRARSVYLRRSRRKRDCTENIFDADSCSDPPPPWRGNCFTQ